MFKKISLASLLAVVFVGLSVGTVGAQQPIMFTEGPFIIDERVPEGVLCDFPVRIQAETVAEQTWFVSSFPPPEDEEWSSLTRFFGYETWTNLNTGQSATDDFRFNIFHDFRGLVLLETVLVGNSTNVPGQMVEAGRVVWEGPGFTDPDWDGTWIQFPDIQDWFQARCDTIASN